MADTPGAAPIASRTWLRWFSRLQARPDLEHEMALNRLVFCVVFAAYFGLTRTSSLTRELLDCSIYAMFATAILVDMVCRPGRSASRRILALLVDFSALGAEMQMGGAATAAFYPLYLWIIFGNGFRFGVRSLVLSSIVAIASFSVVVTCTGYWRDQPLLSGSLLLALVVLPAYAGRLIDKLSQATRLAEAASQSKSRFLASTSHELRTPLNAILGTVSLLRSTKLDPEQRELQDALEIGTRTLLSLIGDILDLSRIEAGRMPIRLEPVDVGDMLRELRVLIRPQASLKGIALRLHVTPRVPPTILADRRHLYDVLLNLVGNAIKFTDAGHVVMSVDATGPAPNGSPSGVQLRFEVTDTGVGIEPDVRDAIFESFTQADAATGERFGGTGLGLAIARQLITLMGGRIGVESVPGKGSRFWFSIDCDAVVTGSVPPWHPSGPTIVLLCEAAGTAERISGYLETIGAAFERARSHEDALARLEAGQATGQSNATVLLLQQEGLEADRPPPPATLRLLDRAAATSIIAIVSRRQPPGREPDPLFQSRVESWIDADADPAGLRAVLRMVSGDAAASAPQMPAVAVRPLHVLIADDNAINLRIMTRILERSGHASRQARNGNEALDALEQEHFDIVLMDVNMPEMDGIEATKLYRAGPQIGARLPIVALTADATPEMAQNCLEAGMDACLTKPVEIDRLIEMIEALVPRPDARPAARRSAPTAAPSPEPPIFDPRVLVNLERLGGAGFVDELLESFVADSTALVRALDAAARSANLELFRTQAHALCSSAANVGAVSVQTMAASCRDVRPNELGSRGRTLAVRLAEEVARLARAIPARA